MLLLRPFPGAEPHIALSPALNLYRPCCIYSNETFRRVTTAIDFVVGTLRFFSGC